LRGVRGPLRGTIGDVIQASTSSRASIRKATEADAEAIVSILEGIVSERIYSAIESAWSADEQRRYLASLSPRETFHVAETDAGAIVGYQSLDLYSTILHSMDHVAQLGTFLRPEARGRGVGQALFESSVKFAHEHVFRKFVVQVRFSNIGARAFYGKLGFRECGRLARQVRLGDDEDDEIIMEFFL
jgi:L-amino acid N-acyltransferase YncA